ncbi:MAG: UvrD-helicase domain-containing protein [Myxococcales bacterium]
MSDLPPLFGLSESAVVQAGAGTGKTHSLVTLCLHLLGGAGRAEPVPAARLWAVTFTEKAAAELKGRIRQRVDALAECPPEEVQRIEPELAASGAPPALLWRRVRRDLGAAQIGTIHGLCGQILRRHAAAAGLDPDFTVLDEVDARQLRADACLAAALEALEGTGPLRDASRRLCAELGFRGAGRFGRGLADELSFLLASLGESGRDVSQVVDATPLLHAGNAVAAEGEARRAFAAALDDLESELRAARMRRAPSPTTIKALSAIEEYRARGAAAIAAALPGELLQAWTQLRGLRGALPRSLSGRAGELMRAAREALETLLEADAQVRSARLSRELALVAAEARRRYRAEKSRVSAVDFDDLTRLTRDLLASDLSVRRLEKARLGVLLVDEFQDTSRPQLELFGWLIEEGEGTAPAGSGLPGARPVARGKLVVVGDRKQSIYEFRGADVAGAQAFAARALQDGAQRFVLRTSRRSLPPLVEFANRLFRTALSAAARPFDTPFGDEDALAAHRAGNDARPCAELLDVLGSGVEAEAEVVSRRIALLLAPGAPERVHGEDSPRPVRGGDVAILLRRFTNVDVFRRALLKRRIPHLVFKGRGFYQAREVTDLTQLLALAVDPDDELALLSVLRSPLGPVSDEGLVLLARHGGHGLRLRAARDPAARESLAPDDAEALDRVLLLVSRVQRECDRLGPAALLQAVLAESDFLAAICGGLYGEQAAANVEKLVGFARQHELHGGNARSFVAQVRRLTDDDAGEADAGVVEESDPHAVRLLTVHAAKGLEFPIVVVPECAAQPRGGPEGVLLDPDLGLALKVRGAGWKRWGTHGLRIRELRKEREAAQARRLFYVAATRARDLLLLSGRAAAPRVETWRQWVDRALPGCAGLIRVLPDGATGGTEPAVVGGTALVESDAELSGAVARAALPELPDPGAAAAMQRARELVARVEQHADGQPYGTVLAPVTQLADASACPRRYQLLHELGLEERPRGAGASTLGGAAERGTLAHRLLELASLEPAEGRARRDELRRIVELEGEDPDSPQNAEVIDAVAAFLDSGLARRMAGADPRQLHRELPFALRVEPRDGDPPGPGLLVRGQLDALLLDSDGATVIDYKLSRAAPPRRYQFQLDAYALAARELTGSTLPVRSGLVFLRSPGAPFAPREAPGAAELESIRRRLLEAARTVAVGRRTAAWPKSEPARCREMECGFLRRCHPEEKEVATGT